MTADEKINIARFINLAAAAAGNGFLYQEQKYCFTDDSIEKGTGEQGKGNSGLNSGFDNPDNNNRSQFPNPRSFQNTDILYKIAGEIKACTRCRLCENRKNAVPGEGVINPVVMVIGEGPGADEDTSGRPFVGKAGQLLDKMLESIGLSRNNNCFLANIIKCRPPANRDPLPDETASCFPFLERQICLLKPRFILCAGRISAQTLLNTTEPISRLRGRFIKFSAGGIETPLIATYHPAALIRNEDLKRPAWEDLKILRSVLEG